MISVPDTNPLVSAIALAITDARIALLGSPSPPAFNPDSLFGAGDGGGVIDIGRLNTLFQDDAGTVPVTATGQVVRSIRARNRPTFLMVLDPDNLEATYELDPQGFPALKAAQSTSRGWAYYLKGDGGLPVTDYSIVMTSLGTYGTGLNSGVGTGWSLFGDSDGSYGTPYEYAGLYTVQPAGDRAEILSTLDEGTQRFPVIENIDGRPYVYSTRSAAGDVDYQVNLEPSIETPNGAALYPAPVGIKFWISPDDYWYGGVFITRYLNETDNLQTQIWCGDLAGITLAPLPVFTPADIFAPTDPGVWYQYYLTPEQQLGAPNMIGFGNELDQVGGGWTYSNVLRTVTALPTPIAGVTAVQVTSTIDNNDNSPVGQNFTNFTAGKRYVFSVHLKRLNYDPITMQSSNFNNFGGEFNLSTGVAIVRIPGTDVSMSDAGDGWWRCAMSFVATTTVDTSLSISLGGLDVDKEIGIGYYVCGAMLEILEETTPSAYAPSTQTAVQQFHNAFPDAHLYQDFTCKIPVFAINQPIWICVDQSQPYTPLPGPWTKTSGDATVTIVGDTITVTGGTTNTQLNHASSIVGSNTWCEIETITGDFTVVTAWIGGQPEFLLNGKNVFGGRNPGTGVNSILFPPGQDYSFKISPLMNSNANTWVAASAAARPLYGLIDGGPAVGAIWDGIDDSGVSQISINFSATDKVSIIMGTQANALPSFGMQLAFNTSGIATPGSFYQTYMPTLDIEVQSLPVGGSSVQGAFRPLLQIAVPGVFTTKLDMGGTQQEQIQVWANQESFAFNFSTPATPPGNYGNHLLWIATNNGSNLLNGVITDVVVIGHATTPLETINTEDFINDNLGAF